MKQLCAVFVVLFGFQVTVQAQVKTMFIEKIEKYKVRYTFRFEKNQNEIHARMCEHFAKDERLREFSVRFFRPIKLAIYTLEFEKEVDDISFDAEYKEKGVYRTNFNQEPPAAIVKQSLKIVTFIHQCCFDNVQMEGSIFASGDKKHFVFLIEKK